MLKERFKKAPIFLGIKHTHTYYITPASRNKIQTKVSRADVFNTTHIVHMPYEDLSSGRHRRFVICKYDRSGGLQVCYKRLKVKFH
jgi:hypothetical protein